MFLLGLLWTPDAVTCQRTYNQFQFVQAWIPTFCKKYRGCFPNLAPNFTLHSLWLATRTGNSVLNCGTSRWDYNIGPETMALAVPLASAWPSIIIGRKDKQLWQYEWDKHGTCCLSRMTKMDYFLSVIRERNKMDLLSILSNANIVPHSDVSYTKLDFLMYHIPSLISKMLLLSSLEWEIAFTFRAMLLTTRMCNCLRFTLVSTTLQPKNVYSTPNDKMASEPIHSRKKWNGDENSPNATKGFRKLLLFGRKTQTGTHQQIEPMDPN
ncbi:unnamed protein product [Camellia sinensis]